jgi:hypothetical protein
LQADKRSENFRTLNATRAAKKNFKRLAATKNPCHASSSMADEDDAEASPSKRQRVDDKSSLSVVLDEEATERCQLCYGDLLVIRTVSSIRMISTSIKYLYQIVALVLNIETKDVFLYRQQDGMFRREEHLGWKLVGGDDEIMGGAYLCRARIGICFCVIFANNV